MDITGWLTLRNLTNSGFRDAQVQVIAGKLNLLDADEGGTQHLWRHRGCGNRRSARRDARANGCEEMQEEFADEDDVDYVDHLQRLLSARHDGGVGAGPHA